MKTLEMSSIASSPSKVCDLTLERTTNPDWGMPINQALQGVTVAKRKEQKRANVRFNQVHLNQWNLVASWILRPFAVMPQHRRGVAAFNKNSPRHVRANIGTEALTHKAPRQEYYWPTMRKQAKVLVHQCDQCQINSRVQRLPSTKSPILIYPIPFALQDLEIIGPMPRLPGQFHFCIVVVDYFTQWVEVKPLVTITSDRVIAFTLKKHNLQLWKLSCHHH